MTGASALTLLSAAVSLVGLAVIYFAGYKRGRSDGYAAGAADLEEALASPSSATARLYRTLNTDRAGLREVMREADRSAQSDVLPDLSGRREVIH